MLVVGKTINMVKHFYLSPHKCHHKYSHRFLCTILAVHRVVLADWIKKGIFHIPIRKTHWVICSNNEWWSKKLNFWHIELVKLPFHLQNASPTPTFDPKHVATRCWQCTSLYHFARFGFEQAKMEEDDQRRWGQEGHWVYAVTRVVSTTEELLHASYTLLYCRILQQMRRQQKNVGKHMSRQPQLWQEMSLSPSVERAHTPTKTHDVLCFIHTITHNCKSVILLYTHAYTSRIKIE